MRFRTILTADWSTRVQGRAVCRADVRGKTVALVAQPDWTFNSLLAYASGAERGPVLVGMDVALGVPRSFLRAARKRKGTRGSTNFLLWLKQGRRYHGFPLASSNHREWRSLRPFFSVPPNQPLSVTPTQKRIDGDFTLPGRGP